MDMTTGLLVQSRIEQTVSNKNGSYIRVIAYALVRFGIAASADESLFKQPVGEMREVKELSRWNAERIRKNLVGKPAPDLTVTDISGNPISLDAYRGRTVLLDFFTTWCPPCRADAPDLEKLSKKYGDQRLAILGISVDEDRGVVEKYLKDNRKSYPVVLTSENDMPRPYQISAFPTYIVIDEQGNVTSAVEGEKGFGDLRGLLQKAGMDPD
jgi:thiol-disulfide isomerase/thioredoxin